MAKTIYPKRYKPILGEKETEHAIVLLKNFFQTALSTELNLTRVTAPLFVRSGTGVNDDLNGVERPVRFPVKTLGEQKLEIVQSLAKWKRLKVTELGLEPTPLPWRRTHAPDLFPPFGGEARRRRISATCG